MKIFSVVLTTVLSAMIITATPQIIGNYTANKIVGGTKPTACQAGPPPDVWVDTTVTPPVMYVCGPSNTLNALAGGSGTSTGQFSAIGVGVAPGAAGSITTSGRVFIGGDLLVGSGLGSGTAGDITLGRSSSVGVLYMDTSNTHEFINISGALSWSGAFSTNGAATAGTGLNTSGTVFMTGLTAEAGTKDAICLDSVSKQLEVNTGVATCTVSSLRYKDWVSDLSCKEANRIVKAMRPGSFRDKGTAQTRYGFAAEWTYVIDPQLVYTEEDGKTPRAIDYERYTAVLTKVLQCGGLK